MTTTKINVGKFTSQLEQGAFSNGEDMAITRKLSQKISYAFPMLEPQDNPEIYKTAEDFFVAVRDESAAENSPEFKKKLEAAIEIGLMNHGGRGNYKQFEKQVQAFMRDIAHYGTYKATETKGTIAL